VLHRRHVRGRCEHVVSGIPVGGIVLEALHVIFVLNKGRHVEIEDLLQALSNSKTGRSVAICQVPDRQYVVLDACGQHATDHVWHFEGLPNTR